MSLSSSTSSSQPLGQVSCGQKIIYCRKNPLEHPNEPRLELIVPCGQSLEPSVTELRRKGYYVAGKDF
jgi:hypothetical protein